MIWTFFSRPPPQQAEYDTLKNTLLVGLQAPQESRFQQLLGREELD